LIVVPYVFRLLNISTSKKFYSDDLFDYILQISCMKYVKCINKWILYLQQFSSGWRCWRVTGWAIYELPSPYHFFQRNVLTVHFESFKYLGFYLMSHTLWMKQHCSRNKEPNLNIYGSVSVDVLRTVGILTSSKCPPSLSFACCLSITPKAPACSSANYVFTEKNLAHFQCWASLDGD
jgi:hypothetical protein